MMIVQVTFSYLLYKVTLVSNANVMMTTCFSDEQLIEADSYY